MSAAQLAVHRIAPEAPKTSALHGAARAVGLSLLLHGTAVAAIAGLALQPQPPQGEAVFVVELISAAAAAPAGVPQAITVPIADNTVHAAAAPPAEVGEPLPEPAMPEPAMLEQVAEAEPEDIPVPPEPVADAVPEPMPLPESRPRRPVRVTVPPRAVAPPAVQPQAPAVAVTQQAAAPAAMAGPAAQATSWHGPEQQVAAAASGSSDEPPLITQPRFRAPPRPPEYPPRARAMEQQGVSVVRALVDTDGTSREIRLWRSSGFDALDRAALVAVRGWLFEAARRGEQPVVAWVEIPVRFEIR